LLAVAFAPEQIAASRQASLTEERCAKEGERCPAGAAAAATTTTTARASGWKAESESRFGQSGRKEDDGRQ
jgi:hypothetical protein